MSAGASRAGQQGLTLLEVLVTLVIMGLVAGIVSQALFQVARIEQRLAGTQLLAMNETLRLEWFPDFTCQAHWPSPCCKVLDAASMLLL